MCNDTIRGTGANSRDNAASLGKLHADLKTHLLKLANSPQLVLNADPNTSHTEAVFLGGSYGDKAFIVEVVQQYHSGTLPYLAELLSGFLIAAANKLDDFTTEFRPDAPLQQLPHSQLQNIFFNATNDLNEGILGFMRRQHRLRPLITDTTLNGIAMYLRNDVDSFIQSQSATFQQWLRGAGRQLQVQAAAENRTHAVAQRAHFEILAQDHQAERAQALQREADRNAALDVYQPIRDELQIKMGRGQMKAELVQHELAWHRQRGLPENWVDANCQPCFIPPKISALKGIEESKVRLRDCIRELQRLGWPTRDELQGHQKMYPGKPLVIANPI